MKGHPILYSPEEMAWLEAHRLLVIGEYHRLFCATFGRTDVSAVNLNSLRKRQGWATGRTGRFEKGAVPANKGKKMPYNANSARTQFKKGNRTGRANHVYKPIGSERLSKEGYLERKVHDGMPFQSRWQTVQRIRWEEVNGPLPAGMVLKCVSGEKLDTDPINWEAVPRALLPRLNGRFGRDYEHAPAELKPVIMTVAKLEHGLRTKGAGR